MKSSDLQIGKVFMYFEPEVAALLQDARQAAVRTLGELAIKHGASTVGPVVNRVEPYLKMLLPGTVLRLDENLSIKYPKA